MTIEKAFRRITVAIDKALATKTQLLPYLRKQILEDIAYNLRTMSDNEVEEYLANPPASTVIGEKGGTSKKEGQI